MQQNAALGDFTRLPEAMESSRITGVVEDLRGALSKASRFFEEAVVDPMLSGTQDATDDWLTENAEWLIEIVFLKLLVACEAIGLASFRERVAESLATAMKSPNHLLQYEKGSDDPYSKWLSVARQYIQAIETLAQTQRVHSVTKDLTDIIRAYTYAICDPKLFPAPPKNEDDVHIRIEGILKCVFTDLKHKPMLTKPIKNFQPDTGLPSIKTLVEYKFVSEHSAVPLIADQIFADTRGYHSPEWETFLYVIYETKRLRREEDWQNHLTSAGIGENTRVIVISGEPSPEDKLPRKRPGAIQKEVA